MHLQVRHSGESRNPRAPEQAWIPAFAGMTNRVIPLVHATEDNCMKTETALNQLDRFSDIDRHFANFLLRLEGREEPKLWLAAALASSATQSGNVCVDLESIAGESLSEQENETPENRAPDLSGWVSVLKAIQGCRRTRGFSTPGAGPGEPSLPLSLLEVRTASCRRSSRACQLGPV